MGRSFGSGLFLNEGGGKEFFMKTVNCLIRESLKTSVFRDLPLKNARFAAQRARNCKGTSKNNRFLEVPLI
jgi:hypothetical protein